MNGYESFPYRACMCGMQQMAMQDQVSPMTEQLESMYPRVYFIIFPHVRLHCDSMDEKHGDMYVPDKEEIRDMVEDIYRKVEKDLRDYDDDKCRNEDMTRQYRPRALARDLIRIILISELLRRRRRRFFPPYGGYSYYGGYPIYPGYQGY